MEKGWDRASFDLNVRPDKVIRDIRQPDLMVPSLARDGRLRLALLCSACGGMLSLLWVWTILMILSVAGVGPGGWLYPIVGCAALVFSVALYLFSVWDFERARQWARDA
jgi:hypothetical protein